MNISSPAFNGTFSHPQCFSSAYDRATSKSAFFETPSNFNATLASVRTFVSDFWNDLTGSQPRSMKNYPALSEAVEAFTKITLISMSIALTGAFIHRCFFKPTENSSVESKKMLFVKASQIEHLKMTPKTATLKISLSDSQKGLSSEKMIGINLKKISSAECEKGFCTITLKNLEKEDLSFEKAVSFKTKAAVSKALPPVPVDVKAATAPTA